MIIPKDSYSNLPLNQPTPYFLLSEDVLVSSYYEFFQAFPKAEIFFALKCSGNLDVVRCLEKLGCNFEFSSSGELDQLVGLGITPDRLLYGTPVKCRKSINHAYGLGVRRYVVDAREEIIKLAETAPESEILIRAAVDNRGSIFSLTDKFGASIDQISKLFALAKSINLNPIGLSFHVGSQALHLEAWQRALDNLCPLIHALCEEGYKLRYLDIGGGFPEQYVSSPGAATLEQIAAHTNLALSALPGNLKLIVEPGRRLVSRSTVLVAEIIGIVKRQSKTWIYLDAGTYNALMEAMKGQGSTRYPVRALLASPAKNGDTAEFVLTGPTCDSLDIIAESVTLPAEISEGDRVVFELAGAYTAALGTNFNGFSIPPTLVRKM